MMVVNALLQGVMKFTPKAIKTIAKRQVIKGVASELFDVDAINQKIADNTMQTAVEAGMPNLGIQQGIVDLTEGATGFIDTLIPGSSLDEFISDKYRLVGTAALLGSNLGTKLGTTIGTALGEKVKQRRNEKISSTPITTPIRVSDPVAAQPTHVTNPYSSLASKRRQDEQLKRAVEGNNE